jgi:hypothetical protein
MRNVLDRSVLTAEFVVLSPALSELPLTFLLREVQHKQLRASQQEKNDSFQTFVLQTSQLTNG